MHNQKLLSGYLGDPRMFRRIGGFVVVCHGHCLALVTGHTARISGIGHQQLVAPHQCHHLLETQQCSPL